MKFFLGIMLAVNGGLCMLIAAASIKNWLLRRRIGANLDSALACDHFEPGNYLYGLTTDEIAHDMSLNAPGCEGEDVELLAVMITDWMLERGIQPRHREALL